MADPVLIKRAELDPDEIDVSGRMRAPSETAVDALIASLGELGVMLDEVHVRELRRQGQPVRLKLMAGGHRVAACRKMGRTVPAKVWRCTDDWARLLELDDNLATAELSPLDMALFLAERRRIYQKLHPETREHHAGAAARWNADDTMSSAFTRTIAEARGISVRHVQRVARAGDALSPEDAAALRAAARERPLTLADLTALSRLGEPEDRAAAIDAFAGGAPSLKAAIRAVRRPAETPPQDPVQEALNDLKMRWRRAPAAARRQFAAELADELVRLIAGGADE